MACPRIKSAALSDTTAAPRFLKHAWLGPGETFDTDRALCSVLVIGEDTAVAQHAVSERAGTTATTATTTMVVNITCHWPQPSEVAELHPRVVNFLKRISIQTCSVSCLKNRD